MLQGDKFVFDSEYINKLKQQVNKSKFLFCFKFCVFYLFNVFY